MSGANPVWPPAPGTGLSAEGTRTPATGADDGHERGDERGTAGVGRPLVLGCIVLVVVGCVLRFVTGSPLWLDEALTVNIAELPLSDLPEALRQDGHPPLYYALLHGWIEVFGSGDAAARALSGVFGILCLPLVWIAGRRLGGSRVAWIAVVLMALNPFAVRYSNEARMYSLVMLLVLAGYLLVTAALESSADGGPSVPRLAGISLVTGALLLSNYWSFYLLAATGLVLVWRARRPGERAGVTRVLVALAAGGVLFAPWLGSFLAQAAHTGTPWADPLRPATVVTETFDAYGGFSAEGQSLGVLLILCVLLAVFGRTLDERRIELDLRTAVGVRAEAAVVALTLAIGIAASFVSRSAFAPRYAAVVFPLVILLAAVGVSRLTRPGVAVGAVLVLVIGSVPGLWYNINRDRTQGGEIVDVVNAEAVPGDVVAYCPDQLGPAFSRHLRGDVDPVVYPTAALPDRIDWRDYEDRNRAADATAFAQGLLTRAGDHTIWIVWSGTYRTFEGACETLIDTLALQRSGVTRVLASGLYFENASLVRFAPAS